MKALYGRKLEKNVIKNIPFEYAYEKLKANLNHSKINLFIFEHKFIYILYRKEQ